MILFLIFLWALSTDHYGVAFWLFVDWLLSNSTS
jgi:hypothetical protein